MMTRFKSYLLAISMICIGCSGSGSRIPINLHDFDAEDSASFTDLEASLPIAGDEHLRLRIRGSKADGEFSQFIPAGDLVRIEDTPFFGPLNLNGTADVSYFSIAIGNEYLRGQYASENLRGFNYIGVAQTNLDATLQIAGSTYRVDDSTTEFYLQGGLVYALSNSLELGLTFAYSTNTENSGVTEIDLLLEYELFRQLRIAGGYRWFEYKYRERPVDSDDSDIIVDFEGPFIGLKLLF